MASKLLFPNILLLLALNAFFTVQVRGSGQQLNLFDVKDLPKDKLEALIAQSTSNLGDPNVTTTLTKKEIAEAKKANAELLKHQAEAAKKQQLLKEKQHVQNKVINNATPKEQVPVVKAPEAVQKPTIKSIPQQPESEESIGDLKQMQILLIVLLLTVIGFFSLIIVCMCSLINRLAANKEKHHRFKDEEQFPQQSTSEGEILRVKTPVFPRTPINLARQNYPGFNFSDLSGVDKSEQKYGLSDKDRSEARGSYQQEVQVNRLQRILSGTNRPKVLTRQNNMVRTKSQPTRNLLKHGYPTTYTVAEKREENPFQKNIELEETASDNKK